MSRVNAEECWWSDPRRSKLALLIGSQMLADGIAINAWRIAQESWKKGELIPWSKFSAMEGADSFIKAGLARFHESADPLSKQVQADPSSIQDLFIYVRGTRDYLSWTVDKQNSGSLGGQKSAQRPRDAKGRLLPNEPEYLTSVQAESKQNPSRPKQIQASASASASKSNTNTYIPSECVSEPPAADSLPAIRQEEKNLPEEIQPGVPAPKRTKFSDLTREKMRAFIAAYAKGYREKYQGTPEGIKDKALIGKLGHWIEHVSEVRAINLVEAYLQISYRPFDENYHDLWQFFRHLNRIGVALDTGKDANSIDWSKVFAGGSSG